MDVNKYLDEAKARIEPPSDYALARELDIEPSAISNYRHGRSKPDNDVLIGLAEILKIDALKLIAEFSRERAKKKREKKFWERLLSTALLLAIMPAVYAVANVGVCILC